MHADAQEYVSESSGHQNSGSSCTLVVGVLFLVFVVVVVVQGLFSSVDPSGICLRNQQMLEN